MSALRLLSFVFLTSTLSLSCLLFSIFSEEKPVFVPQDSSNSRKRNRELEIKTMTKKTQKKAWKDLAGTGDGGRGWCLLLQSSHLSTDENIHLLRSEPLVTHLNILHLDMHHLRHSENFLSVRFPIHNHYRIARTHGNSDTKLQAPGFSWGPCTRPPKWGWATGCTRDTVFVSRLTVRNYLGWSQGVCVSSVGKAISRVDVWIAK